MAWRMYALYRVPSSCICTDEMPNKSNQIKSNPNVCIIYKVVIKKYLIYFSRHISHVLRHLLCYGNKFIHSFIHSASNTSACAYICESI